MGVQVVFIQQPRWDMSRLFESEDRLPSGNLIDLSDPVDHPLLYERSNLFDIMHLNAKGAKIATEALANAFLKMRQGLGVQKSMQVPDGIAR